MDVGGVVHSRGDAGRKSVTERHTRTLAVTEDLVRAYSRRGNYHSDPELSADLRLPGLVAQGVQAAGPAYGLLLDEWGEEFLAHGEIEMRFVGIVLAGDTIDASVEIDAGDASFTVTDTTAAHPAVVGTATRRATPGG
jgi:acyl dehydratase